MNQVHSEYTARINRVLDYVESHLTEELSLDVLADVAGFSRFHFHRIFRALTGETLNRFIQRRRIEKAASQLVHNLSKSITEVALDCGFSGSAAFARAFRDAFGMSASDWRAGGYKNHSKNRQTDRKDGEAVRNHRKAIESTSMYIDDVTHNPTWRFDMVDKTQVKVEVKDLPDMTVAYVRHIGPYQGNAELFESLFNKLFMWAGPRGLVRPPETTVMSVYYDDPAVTDDDKLRLDVALTVPEDTEVDGEIGKMVVPGGKCAVARFELAPQEYEQAWGLVFGEWLPQSGYQPDDRPSLEFYQNNPKEHPEGKHIVDIVVPVKPL